MRQKIGTINFWHVKHMFKEDVWVAGGLGKAFFCSIGCIQGIFLLRNVIAKSASRTWDVDGDRMWTCFYIMWQFGSIPVLPEWKFPSVFCFMVKL